MVQVSTWCSVRTSVRLCLHVCDELLCAATFHARTLGVGRALFASVVGRVWHSIIGRHRVAHDDGGTMPCGRVRQSLRHAQVRQVVGRHAIDHVCASVVAWCEFAAFACAFCLCCSRQHFASACSGVRLLRAPAVKRTVVGYPHVLAPHKTRAQQ